eukprot:scaffold12417_cov131-Isochrysis_galbana.AAC.13
MSDASVPRDASVTRDASVARETSAARETSVARKDGGALIPLSPLTPASLPVEGGGARDAAMVPTAAALGGTPPVGTALGVEACGRSLVSRKSRRSSMFSLLRRAFSLASSRSSRARVAKRSASTACFGPTPSGASPRGGGKPAEPAHDEAGAPA